MMRDILFKGKRLDNGKWVEGLIGHPHVTDTEKGVESYYFHAKDKMDFWSQCTVSAETICQYTGLTDKNGNKIWENDIVKHGLITETVIFKDGSFGVYSNGSAVHLHVCHKKLEVIGNIFDNHELLKGGE